MKIIDLVQGSPEWLAHRDNHDNASEAAAMLAEHPNLSRTALIVKYATGICQEFSAWVQENILNRGHIFEDLARPLAEELIGEELYPDTGCEGRLSASFDGLTIDQSVAFEHKSLNKILRACKSVADLPIYHRIQMEQQLLVSDAKKCMFMASEWEKAPGEDVEQSRVYGRVFDERTQTEVRYVLIDEIHFWYKPDLELRARIVAGWKQFHIDVKNYKPAVEVPVITAEVIDDLPALTVEMVGEVTSSNLAIFKAAVTTRIKAINTDLQTDADFVNAESMVKFLDAGEKRLDLVKSQALSQTASIDELFRTIDSLKEEMKNKRLDLDKLVKARKVSIRIEKQQDGKAKLDAHIESLNKALKRVKIPAITADFAGSMKNKKTIASLDGAIADTLALATMEANRLAESIQENLNLIDQYADHAFLFNDLPVLCLKAADDLQAVITNRINAHAQDIQKKKDAEAEQRQARIDALKVIADKRPRVAEKLEKDRAEVIVWQAKVEDTREKASGAKTNPLACPHCAGTLNILHGVLVPYEEPKVKHDPEAAAALPEYERALALLKNSVINGERDMKAVEDAELQMRALAPEADNETLRKAA